MNMMPIPKLGIAVSMNCTARDVAAFDLALTTPVERDPGFPYSMTREELDEFVRAGYGEDDLVVDATMVLTRGTSDGRNLPMGE